MVDNNMTPFANASHPDAAHFHTGTLVNIAPFTQVFPMNTGGNGVQDMLAAGGTVNNGNTWVPSIVRLHDFGNKETQNGVTGPKDGATAGNTEFTVTETPVPTPLPGPAIGGVVAYYMGLEWVPIAAAIFSVAALTLTYKILPESLDPKHRTPPQELRRYTAGSILHALVRPRIGPMIVMSSFNGSVWKTTTSERERSGRYGGCDGGNRGSSRWLNAPSFRRAEAPPPIVGTG
jgi:hypothetical protein